MRKSASKTYIKTTTWNQNLEPGATLEGRYIANDSIKSKFDNKDVIKYIIEAPDGTNYGVFGTTSIERQFANIPVGSYVWITYKGEEPTKNGRTVKAFDIDYDDEA